MNLKELRIKELVEYIDGIRKKIIILDGYLKVEKYHKYPPITVDKIQIKLDDFISELCQELIELEKNKYYFE